MRNHVIRDMVRLQVTGNGLCDSHTLLLAASTAVLWPSRLGGDDSTQAAQGCPAMEAANLLAGEYSMSRSTCRGSVPGSGNRNPMRAFSQCATCACRR